MAELNGENYIRMADVTFGLISGKWKLPTLIYLSHHTKKSYSEIRINLPGISEKMLSQQLKELERNNLIRKTILSEKPYRVEYELTDTGKSLSPLYEFICGWGEQLHKNKQN